MSDLIVYSRRKKVDWSFLPEEILEQVVARVSFPEVCRLRCVCKQWKALVQKQFQERALHGGVPWGPFYLEQFERQGRRSRAVPFVGYELLETTVRETTMPQLEFPECARRTSWVLVASGGGLLCFFAWGRRRLLVCNPMTKAWRELPAMNCVYKARWAFFTHMVVDVRTNSYKILLAGKGGVDYYDSVADKWSMVEYLTRDTKFQTGAFTNGEMYFLGDNVVMVLEVSTLRWRAGTIRMPATPLMYPEILVCGGEVYLVGGSSENTNTEPPLWTIPLFRLDSGGNWTRVCAYVYDAGFIPLLDMLFCNTGANFRCGAHGGQIFVVRRGGVAVYTCATGVLEERVTETSLWTNIFDMRFAFEPNLVAAP